MKNIVSLNLKIDTLLKYSPFLFSLCSFWPTFAYLILEELEGGFLSTFWCRLCWTGSWVEIGKERCIFCIMKCKIVQFHYLQHESKCYFCSDKLEGRSISCRLSDKVCCSNYIANFILCCWEEIVSFNLHVSIRIAVIRMLNFFYLLRRQTDNYANGLKMMMHLSVLLTESMSLTKYVQVSSHT